MNPALSKSSTVLEMRRVPGNGKTARPEVLFGISEGPPTVEERKFPAMYAQKRYEKANRVVTNVL